MPIPALLANGLLPEGVHDASLDEVRAAFGQFQGTDRRVRIFEGLARYVDAARTSGMARVRFDCDAQVAIDAQPVSRAVDFFAQVRGRPGERKGMVRVTL